MLESNSPQRLALSVPEAAKSSGLSRSMIYNELSAGRLASIKIGARRLIRIADLEAWLAAHVSS